MTTALILGAAVQAQGPSPALRRRTIHAAQLFRAGRVHHLIPCGGAGRHPPTEAQAMAQILLGEGVPAEAITPEDQSRNTFENIANAKPLLDSGPVVIVTDWYHAPRARMVARRLGIAARVACPSPWSGRLWPQLRSAIREVPACLYYLARPRR